MAWKGAMRIGIDTTGLSGAGCSAEETYLRSVTATLRSIQPSLQVVFFTTSENHDRFDGWNRTRLSDLPRGLGRLFVSPTRPLESLAGKVGVDAVFTALSTAPQSLPVPFVLYALDAHGLDSQARANRGAKARLKRMRTACQAARTVVVPSKHVRDALLTHLGVPLDKVQIAPLGVDAVFETPPPPIVEPPYVLLLTHPRADDAFAVAVEGCLKTRDVFGGAVVLLGVGGDSQLGALKDRALRFERCPAPQLASLYHHSRVVICPHPYEGAGLAVLQALRAGARVVTAKTGGIQDVAGSAPLYYNPDSVSSLIAALRKAAEEPAEERDAAVRAGQKAASEFTWENCAWKTLHAFRKE